jgi:hypothetical protein
MNKQIRLLLCVGSVMLLTTHRLPAPISEIATPTPASKEETKPKKTRSKSRTVESESKTKSAPKSSATQSLQGPARFAGTWRGTIDFGIFNGSADVTLAIDASATSVNETNRFISGTRALKNNGTSVSWREASFNSASWTFTPNPDGKTALVKLTDILINSSAVFRRD